MRTLVQPPMYPENADSGDAGDGGPGRLTYVGKSGYHRQPDLGNYWLRARVYEDGTG